VAVVKSELKNLVPDFAASMLQPPTQRVGKNYYSSAVFKEHKGYFKKEMVKKEASIHNYQYTGEWMEERGIRWGVCGRGRNVLFCIANTLTPLSFKVRTVPPIS